MNEKLMERAHYYLEELHEHPVLRAYWRKLSVVLKGSTARGDADAYSDVDFVLFTDGETLGEIVAAYRTAEYITRTDGIFLPLGDWEGHYNLDTYAHLAAYFAEKRLDMVWEYVNTVPLHDPDGAYLRVLEAGQSGLFADMEGLLKRQYLDIQLHLDWMRQPLRRADAGAALMYYAEVLRGVARMAFLLKETPYPCDKWLFRYLDRLGSPLEADVKAALGALGTLNELAAGRELMDYDAYRLCVQAVEAVKAALRARLGEALWIEVWSLYV